MRLVSLLALLLSAPLAHAQGLVGLTSCCPNEVVTVSASGDTTTVAAIGGSGDAFIATVGSVVIDADGGRAFLVRNGVFASVDLTTGAVSEGGDAGEIIQLAGFDTGRGVLYAFATRRDTLQTSRDVRLRNYAVAYDPLAQDTTHLAQVGEYLILDNVPQGGDLFSTVTGPAVASSDALYTIRNGRLLEVDLATGALNEGAGDLSLPEVSGTDGTWLYRTEREETGPDTLRTYTGRLLRQPLAGGPDAAADTVAVLGVATVDAGTGAIDGDVFLASLGMAFYDEGGDRLLLNRNGMLLEVDLSTTQTREIAPAGRIRYVPAPASAVVAVDGGPGASSLSLGAAPNPSRGAVGLAFALVEPAEAEVAVYDALGREVAVLHEGALSAGTHLLVWDGEAAPGAYVVRATMAGETVSVPVTIVE